MMPSEVWILSVPSKGGRTCMSILCVCVCVCVCVFMSFLQDDAISACSGAIGLCTVVGLMLGEASGTGKLELCVHRGHLNTRSVCAQRCTVVLKYRKQCHRECSHCCAPGHCRVRLCTEGDTRVRVLKEAGEMLISSASIP